jgi:hypothetical protein
MHCEREVRDRDESRSQEALAAPLADRFLRTCGSRGYRGSGGSRRYQGNCVRRGLRCCPRGADLGLCFVPRLVHTPALDAGRLGECSGMHPDGVTSHACLSGRAETRGQSSRGSTPLRCPVRFSLDTRAVAGAGRWRVSQSASCCLLSRPGLSAVLCVASVGEAGVGQRP